MTNKGMQLSYINSNVDESGERFFVPGNANCIAKCDCKGDIGKIITWLEIHNQFTNNYLNVCKWKDILLCVPLHSDKFVAVNKKTCEVKYFDIPRKNNSRMNYSFFNAVYQNDNNIYSLGLGYDGFVRFDCDKFEIEVVDDWMEKIKSYITERKDFLFRRQKHIIYNKLYVAGNEFKGVFIYDFINNDYEIDPINAIRGNICGLLPKADFWWIMTEENILYKYDYTTQSIFETFQIKIDSNLEQKAQYQYLYECEDKIFMYSENGKVLHSFNTLNGENYTISKINELFPENVGPYISRYDNNTLLFSNGDCNYMYKFNMKEKTFEKYVIEVDMSSDDLKKYIEEIGADDLNESMWSLRTFIEYIKT